jgi:hypothetical protein
VKEGLPIDAQVAISQTHLDQCWERFREHIERLTPEQINRLFTLPRPTAGVVNLQITAHEWAIVAISVQLALKQSATNTVRRAMEDTQL